MARTRAAPVDDGSVRAPLGAVPTSYHELCSWIEHRKATLPKRLREVAAFVLAHPDEIVAMAGQKLGMKKEAVAASLNNVALNWEMTPAMIAESKTYAQQMLELKQIRALPDFGLFMDKRFSDDVARAA